MSGNVLTWSLFFLECVLCGWVVCGSFCGSLGQLYIYVNMYQYG